MTLSIRITRLKNENWLIFFPLIYSQQIVKKDTYLIHKYMYIIVKERRISTLSKLSFTSLRHRMMEHVSPTWSVYRSDFWHETMLFSLRSKSFVDTRVTMCYCAWAIVFVHTHFCALSITHIAVVSSASRTHCGDRCLWGSMMQLSTPSIALENRPGCSTLKPKDFVLPWHIITHRSMK